MPPKSLLNRSPRRRVGPGAYFPDIDQNGLAKCIAIYQELGCWSSHVEITRPAFEVTRDRFEHVGRLKERYRDEQVCAEPTPSDRRGEGGAPLGQSAAGGR